MSRILELTRQEWIFILMLLFAFGCAVYKLTEVPPTWYDEGMITQLAVNLARYGTMATQIAPGMFVSGAYTSTGFPVVFPIALSFKLFGISLAAARGVMVLYLLLFLCASYFFLVRKAGRTAALFSIALLITFSTLYGDGKNVLGEVPGLFYLVLFLIFADRFFEDGQMTKWNIILAGLFAGLCIATKPTFLVLGGAIVIALGYSYLVHRKKVPLIHMVYGAVAVLVPVLVWSVTQFSFEDSFPKVLAFYANPYRLEHIPTLIVQNLLRFFHESTPLYLLGMLVAWSASVILRLWRRVRISFSETAAFSFALLILLAYLRTPGWYRYFFPVQIIAILFFPVSLALLAQRVSITKYAILARRGAIVLLVFLIGLQSYLLYSGSWVSQYYKADRTATLRNYFGNLDPALIVFVYDAPDIPIFLPPKTPYYQYISVNAKGYWGLGAEEIFLIGKGIPDVIVVPQGDALESFLGYREQDTVGGISVLYRE